MDIKVKKVTGWDLVLDSARWTVNKVGLDKEPSDSFKKQMLISEHSPIRDLRFIVEMRGIPNFSSQQISRHDCFAGHSHRNGSADQNYVGTSRSDRTDKVDTEINRLTPTDHRISLSAADFIELSKKRLCYGMASRQTREVWETVISELAKIEPFLASVSQPNCIYRAFCPEENSCGYDKTKSYVERLEEYRNFNK